MDEVIASVAPTLQARIGSFRAKHRLPGVAAGIADRHGLRWWHASGFADIETGRRADEQTLYRIASITKTITATAVLQLRDEGRVRLDDPTVRFIPELAQLSDSDGPIEDLTIRRLLTHTSGLQGEAPWQDLDRWWLYRPEELVEVLHLGHVRTPPEVDHKYSNLGYELLGILVARVAGRPFVDYARVSILGPLGMTDTAWDLDDDQAGRTAMGYDARSHDDRPPRARAFDSRHGTANGGLWSTLDDLGRWIGQQLRSELDLERGERQVLRGATLTEMHRPSFIANAGWTEAQGLGWYGTRSGETILIGHSGMLWGFTSDVSFSPSGRVGAIVLINGIGDAPALARELLETLLPALREAEDRAEVPEIAPCPEAYRELLGAYRDPEFGDDRIVEWRAGKLVLLGDRPESPVHDLVATDDALIFTIRDGRPGGEPLVFSRGLGGRIERCNVGGFPAMRVGMLRPPTWL